MKFLKIENYLDYQVISLNRPEVKNAFHPEMIQEITETFLSLNLNKAIRALYLQGEGSAFCAGADLVWMKLMVDFTLDENLQEAERLWQMFEAIAFCEIPVIGSVQGAVYGGALGLLACCDYVFAESQTKFCFSEVKLGLVPAIISSFILRKIPDGFVRPLMLSAEIFSAQKAQHCGLVHAIYEGPFDLKNKTESFSLNGLEAMRETKKLLNLLPKKNWMEQKKVTTHIISERRLSAEGQKRLKIFLDKN